MRRQSRKFVVDPKSRRPCFKARRFQQISHRAQNLISKSFRFLSEKDSQDYKSYRKLVVKYREHPELLEKDRSSERSNPSDRSDSEGEPAENKERRSSPPESGKQF